METDHLNPNTSALAGTVSTSEKNELQTLSHERNRQFFGVTIFYLALGIGCFFFRNGDPDRSPADFLLHGWITLGLSALYLGVILTLFYYYDGLCAPFVRAIPSNLDEIAQKAKQIASLPESDKYIQMLQKSTGYLKLIGLKVAPYAEIRILRDFGRVIAPVVVVIAFNLGGKHHAVEMSLLLIVAIFTWISTSRYQKLLDFLATLRN